MIEFTSAMWARDDGTIERVEGVIIGPPGAPGIARPEALDHIRTGSTGYPFEPNYDACADPDCGEVWSPRGERCPVCGGPAIGFPR